MTKGIDSITERRKRITRSLGIIRALEEVGYAKAVSLICYNTGVNDIKAREYIDILKNIGAVDVREGVVYVRKDFKQAGDGANE